MQPASKGMAPDCTYREPIIHPTLRQKLSNTCWVNRNSRRERRRLERGWKRRMERYSLAMRLRLFSTKMSVSLCPQNPLCVPANPGLELKIPNSKLPVPIWHSRCSAPPSLDKSNRLRQTPSCIAILGVHKNDA